MASIIDRARNTPQPSTPVLTSSMLFGCILFIGLITIGAVYLNDCPIQPFIPIYLIVFGVFCLSLIVVLGLCTKYMSHMMVNICIHWYLLSMLFLFCWLIAGDVWIYSIYQPNYVKNTTDLESYCNKTLYLFTFWSTTLVNILVGLLLAFGACYLCFLIFRKAKPDNDV